MARIRTIKPGFFTSEDIAGLSLRARLTFIGLWTHADDNGRAKANPRLVKAAVWPLDDDVTVNGVRDDLVELERADRITTYVVDGVEYLQIVRWHEHQKIDRPTVSSIPPPPGAEPEPSTRRTLDEPSTSPRPRKGREGKGREGTRADGAPPPFCPRHPDGTDRPCGPCGVARRAHESWRPPTPSPPSVAELRARGVIP